MSIQKDSCVIVAQELEFILNLHVISVLLGNRYSRTMCGGFLFLDLPLSISFYFTKNVLV